MKTHFSFFVFIFLLLLVKTYPGTAQDTIIFDLVTPPVGLHPGSKAGIQDAQGYMWIGTYQAPLRRYDGYHYTFYSNDPLDSNSLAQNWVEALCAGRDGTIWIGTADRGVDQLDPSTSHFKHFRHNPKDSNSLGNNNVTAILEDREGVIWIGTLGGLNTYNLKTGKFNRYYHNPNDSNSLSCNQVMKIYEDRQGTIWVGTGSVWLDQGGETDEGGLNRFDRKTGKFIQYLHEPANPHSLVNNKVKAIFEDSRGVFWVGTAGDGLHTMNREKGTFDRHPYDPAHPEKLSRPPQKTIRPYAADHITFIIEDASGAIWIGTFGNGLNRYDPKTNKVTHYPLFKDPVSGMQLEVPWWASTSRDGMLWIGYFRGLYRIDPLRKKMPYFATGTAVEEMHEDKFGVLWYGTDQGLVRKDPISGTQQHFVFDPNNPRSIGSNRINAIYEDHQGELWIGTPKGLDRFDRKTSTFSRYRLNSDRDNNLIDDGVGSIYEDPQGLFWLGNHQGLICINRQEHTIIKHYGYSPEDPNSLSKGEVILIYEDRSGNLWLGTFGGTLNRLSPRTGKVQQFLNGTNIHSLWQDSEGILWVGTSIGLYRSNVDLSGFSRFNGPNGEFAGNMIVNGVVEDNQKNLWINASVGICRLNPQRSKILTFSRHGDPTWYNGTGCCKGKKGELFFGGGSGYFTFFPEQLKENTRAPQIVLSAFRIDDHLIVPGKESPLKEPLSQAKEIRLHYNQNVLSFDFAGIHYSNPEQNPHLFMLEGLDNTWRKAGEEKTAYYDNVPSGQYIFRVKAANSDGVWAEKAIVIVIAPPWWHTWWAYILYSLIFLVALWSFIKWRERILQKEKLLLEEKVITRTHELQKEKEKVESTLAELEAAQGQLIEAEKKASTEKLKQAVLNERLRISGELHDEVGATLSSISIFSQAAIQKTESGNIAESKNILKRIGETSREVLGELNEAVWLINPLNDNLHKIIQRISNYALPLCRTSNIHLQIKTAGAVENLDLSVEKRKAIYLIIKEAVNNSLKYAAAKNLVIQFEKNCNTLYIFIKDDGRGFAKNNSSTGNGLNNMKQRAKDVNGKICFDSVKQEGTEVILEIPLTNIGD